MTSKQKREGDWRRRRAEYLMRAGRTAELRAEGLVPFIGEPMPPADVIEQHKRRRTIQPRGQSKVQFLEN